MCWLPKCLPKTPLRVKHDFHSRRTLQTSTTWSKQFKILFMGRDEFSCLVLQELHRSDVWEEIHLATNPDEKVDRGSRLSVSPLKVLGHSLGLPVHIIPPKAEFRNWIIPPPFSDVNNGPPPLQHIIITASFGRILPFKMLKSFAPDRRLNIHPSLLPAYRGAAPIQHAIMNDEKETGVCVTNMLKRSEGIDAGPIWGIRRLSMPENIVFSDLRDELAVEGGQLLASVLRDMMIGKAVSKIQPQTNISFAPTISFKDATLDFTTTTAEAIVRTHRAIGHQRPLTVYLPTIKTLQMHLPSVHVSPPPYTPTVPGRACYSKPDKAILLRCADNSVLSILKVKQEGRALLDAREWWSGAKSFGLVVNNEINFDSQDDVDQWLQPEFIG
ncbi:formyl transferase [Lentinula aciculospora]|uniref:methionyl-tRNA formyltransferase n=1 Tax=Lentinula aciculospora TaxID=153920 RepID=A0A9W9AVZ2_9AGAR|nr:formyl transferase [Lentinula aciculospora]